MELSRNLNSLSVGNRTIDSEHQKLGTNINDIGQLLLVNHVVALSVAIKMLTDSLEEYFSVEESIAKAANFDFTKHKLAHQTLLDNFKLITDKLISQNIKLSEIERKVCIDSLYELLIRHIKCDSKSFKLVLDAYLYDFRSSESEVPPALRGCGWVLQVN